MVERYSIDALTAIYYPATKSILALGRDAHEGKVFSFVCDEDKLEPEKVDKVVLGPGINAPLSIDQEKLAFDHNSRGYWEVIEVDDVFFKGLTGLCNYLKKERARRIWR